MTDSAAEERLALCVHPMEDGPCGYDRGHPFHTNEAWEIPGMAELAHTFEPALDDDGIDVAEARAREAD